MGTIQSEANLDAKKIVIKIFLFIALSVLLIINAYQQGYEGVILYLNWAIAVAAAIMCIIEIRAFLFKKNNVGLRKKTVIKRLQHKFIGKEENSKRLFSHV